MSSATVRAIIRGETISPLTSLCLKSGLRLHDSLSALLAQFKWSQTSGTRSSECVYLNGCECVSLSLCCFRFRMSRRCKKNKKHARDVTSLPGPIPPHPVPPVSSLSIRPCSPSGACLMRIRHVGVQGPGKATAGERMGTTERNKRLPTTASPRGRGVHSFGKDANKKQNWNFLRSKLINRSSCHCNFE